MNKLSGKKGFTLLLNKQIRVINGFVSIPNQEDHACVPKRPVTRCASVAEDTSACRHGFYPWVNWSSGTGCSPLVGVSWEPRALPVGLHR